MGVKTCDSGGLWLCDSEGGGGFVVTVNFGHVNADHYMFFPILRVPLCTLYGNEGNLHALHAPALAIYMYMQVHCTCE